MAKPGLLLYGANGYTGRLIAEEALRRGIRPVLAGRRREALERLASLQKLDFSVFPLEDPAAVAEKIAPFSALVLAAGPFSATSAVAVEACLRAKTSYLDITGEIAVFEAVFARHGEAVKAGIALLPGTGFDVVPSDCLAASLAEALPGAETLELAFRGAGVSAGTMKTMIEGLPKGGAARVNGKIVRVPAAWKTKTIPFPDKPRLGMTIPWGDISTAWRSTGIPNIEVYMSLPPKAIAAARRTRFLAPLLGLTPVQGFLKARASRIAGPSEEERKSERSFLWGRVTKGDRAVAGTLETPEGYALTAMTSVEIAKRVLAGATEPGAWTPSQAFGADFIARIPGTNLTVPA